MVHGGVGLACGVFSAAGPDGCPPRLMRGGLRRLTGPASHASCMETVFLTSAPEINRNLPRRAIRGRPRED